MNALYSLWLLLHVIGLALGVGAATVKFILLLRTRTEPDFLPVYLRVHRPITRILIFGLILLTVSGIGWIISPGGYSFTPTLIAKLVLVVAIWVVGPIIDNVLEPRFQAAMPAPGETPSPTFVTARSQLVAVEALATGLFYAITVLGVVLY